MGLDSTENSTNAIRSNRNVDVKNKKPEPGTSMNSLYWKDKSRHSKFDEDEESFNRKSLMNSRKKNSS